MRTSMIVVAGGSGTRMGSELPKQFIELSGKPILMHTLETMHQFDTEMQLILVLPENQINTWQKLCALHSWSIAHQLTSGGETRFFSVRNGLKLAQGDLVGVHDGVRPFVSEEVIANCFVAAEKNGAAVPVVPIVQSLRKVGATENQAVNRDDFRAVQTPQCFKKEVLEHAFGNAKRADYSDDASVVEANGCAITLVDGNAENIKITTPFDLGLGQLIIERRNASK